MAKKEKPEAVAGYEARGDLLMSLKEKAEEIEVQLKEGKRFLVEEAKKIIGIGETSLYFTTSNAKARVRVTIPLTYKYKLKTEPEKIPKKLLDKFFTQKPDIKYIPVENFEALAEKTPEIYDWVEKEPNSPTVTIP